MHFTFRQSCQLNLEEVIYNGDGMLDDEIILYDLFLKFRNASGIEEVSLNLYSIQIQYFLGVSTI